MKKLSPFDLAPAAHDEEPELVLGTNQPDTITTGGGPQHIISGNGDDVVQAGGGPDIVEAGNGNDTVDGGGGPDQIFGGNGDDYLVGAGGPDEINGGRGDDVLFGGVGPDTLTGGSGADTFVYTDAGDDEHGDGSDHQGEGGGLGEEDAHDGGGDDGRVETITDFQPGIDHFDFSQLSSVNGLSEGPAANSVWFEQVGQDTIVRVDTDGNLSGEHAGAELSILLVGVNAHSLSAHDFIL